MLRRFCGNRRAGGWWAVLALSLGLGASLPTRSAAQVAHYTLDNTVNDSIGTSHGTALGAPTYTAGQLGFAISLNGTTQAVSLGTPAALDLPGAMTIAAWVRPTASGTDRCIVCDFSAGGTSGQYVFFFTPADILSMMWLDETNLAQFDSDSPVAITGTWLHVAMTRSAANVITLYVNGSVIGASFVTGSSAIAAVADPFGVSLGRGGAYDGIYFPGQLDEVRLYNTELSAGQILALAQIPPARRRPVLY